MMRKTLYSKKNKVNLTAIKVTSINEKEKAKLQATAQRRFGMFCGKPRKKKSAKFVAKLRVTKGQIPLLYYNS